MIALLGKRWLRALAAALVLIWQPISAALAMRVSPMVVEMSSRGSDAVARIEVQNVNPANLAFETRIYRMNFDANGKVVETPADDMFLVFPPQGVLPAGGRQVVRLQWVGPADPPTSDAFYVSFNQLPVVLEPAKSDTVAAQVQVVYHMKALVVVAPPGAKPNVEAASVRPITYQPDASQSGSVAKPGPGVEITLKNSGRRHAMMSAFGWRLEGTGVDGKPLRIDLSPEELNRAVGTGYVPALGQRTFKIPLVAPFGPQPIKLSFVG